MTRRQFKHLARVLKNRKPVEHTNSTEAQHQYFHLRLASWEAMCMELAEFCSTYNNTFDRYRFLTACGVDEDE